MRHYLARSILAAMISLVPITANAQVLCGPRREVIDAIKATHGETESWWGHLHGMPGVVALLLTGPEGTWTMLQVAPDVACVVGGGTNSTLVFGDPT